MTDEAYQRYHTVSGEKYVYIITNKINGKKYVGCSHNPYYRFKAHMGELKGGRHTSKSFLAEYRKYGDCFELEVIAGPMPDREAFNYEHMKQIELKTYDSRFGYNDSDSGLNSVRRQNGLSYRVHPAKGKKRKKEPDNE